ncbi:MAG: Mrp/NBP35 family ATP-binding protein [Negativicutes bacterium]|nr:Mrp/NBP35 family ATP-binding protein [Negativicutes bacterium]
MNDTTCDHNCEQCSSNCESRQPQDLKAPLHPMSQVGKVIGVVSGKGGVGKSLVTSLLAIAMQRRGFHTAILDADLTGPSIPRIFGLTAKATSDETGLYPVYSKTGIAVMSINLLLENAEDPVVWRGPVIAGTVKQFWTEVIWDRIDTMFVDLPPGTGDVPLTVFQSLPIDGIVIVTSPQELVSVIVGKAIKMAKLMNIPIYGLIENMSYLLCPDCGKKISVFGPYHLQEVAAKHKIPVLGEIPIDPALAAACDRGELELLEQNYLQPAVDLIDASAGRHQE